ncbi:hypothetical protein LCGC14_1693100 [marine sediment metagenome]|uniref:TubC N-terminal docking domain-containing protein n=1 Tax=marine sediment metagenome TaxID=412755 RepID=A0A0F9KKA2_9ZZZZ
MSAGAILAGLEALGATVRADGDRLVVEAPPGVLTPDKLAVLQADKADALTWARDRLGRFQADYDAAIRRWYAAETYFDGSVSPEERARHAPAVDGLSERIGYLTEKIASTLGRPMTPDKLLHGFAENEKEVSCGV